MQSCPCNSGRNYDECCGPVISGAQPAATAEALMRSRYTAYVVRDVEHLRRTLTPEQQQDFSAEDARKWAENSEWLGFTILKQEGGGPEDIEGSVEFVARFRTSGQEHEHLENARFVKQEGQWLYAGNIPAQGQTVRRESPKVGRNDPCPCGSGKKFKKCCGAAA